MNNLILATAIFILTYLIIVSEKIHRTIVVLVGAALFLVLKILEQHEALEVIDFNTLGLLVGMMLIVGIVRQTGLLEYIAIKQAKVAEGDPWKIMLMLSLITAVGSAFLDNVTTILILVPVTLAITKALELPPAPFVIMEIIICNIGGTATLIGDPPNIMIGSAENLSFMDFIINLTPIVLVIFLVSIYLLKLIYLKDLQLKKELQVKLMSMDEKKELKDWLLAKKSLIGLGLTILGFVLHHALHLELATIALAGAAFLLLISGVNVEKALDEVEWSVIFFFIGLFILVGGIEKVGLIEIIAQKALDLTEGNIVLLSMVVLWGAGVGSALLSNIPFVAAAIPLLQAMQSQLPQLDFLPVWWALALGSCLGGNGTLIGSPANVAAAGLAEEEGVLIRFSDFLKIGFPLMLVSLVISTVYILLRYF